MWGLADKKRQRTETEGPCARPVAGSHRGARTCAGQRPGRGLVAVSAEAAAARQWRGGVWRVARMARGLVAAPRTDLRRTVGADARGGSRDFSNGCSSFDASPTHYYKRVKCTGGP